MTMTANPYSGRSSWFIFMFTFTDKLPAVPSPKVQVHVPDLQSHASRLLIFRTELLIAVSTMFSYVSPGDMVLWGERIAIAG
jgi:hypothetical protein